jgi:hypothetical protein
MEFPLGDTVPDAVSPGPDAGTERPAERRPADGQPAGERRAEGRPASGRLTTGDARVDDAVARLDDLADLPIAEHLAVFEYVHERLTEALGDLNVHASARSGDLAPGPGGPGG